MQLPVTGVKSDISFAHCSSTLISLQTHMSEKIFIKKGSATINPILGGTTQLFVFIR